MRASLLCIVFLTLLSGCTESPEKAPPPAAEDAPRDRHQAFLDSLAKGSNPEIREAAEVYFAVGAKAADVEPALSVAQGRAEAEGVTTYRLWFRGVDPDLEGDGWVEVEVEAAAIRSVRSVVLRK